MIPNSGLPMIPNAGLGLIPAQGGDPCADPAARLVALVLCNANAIRDDAWSIALDGTTLGTYNVNTNTQDAVIFLPMSLASLPIDPSVYAGCSTLKSVYYTTLLDPIAQGAHTLLFTWLSSNGSGNLFEVATVGVANEGGAVVARGSGCFYGQAVASVSGSYGPGSTVSRTFGV